MGHFLRQFFQGGDAAAAETSMVRALAGVAAPMLITAFWIVTLAGALRGWGAAGVHYLFVLYAFCAMGCVTTLQWERLFPERMDFLVLLPMPLRGWTIFAAKLRAVAVLLLLFLFAANVFGTLLLPVLAGRRLPVAMFAHAVAVFAAGAASALGVLALESLVVAMVPERLFRYVAPVVQAVLVSAFLVLFLRMGIVTESLPVLLSGQSDVGRWFPPLWFLAVYEVCLGGPAATPYAYMLAREAWLCLPVLLVCAVSLYPAAWARRQRMALEGTRSAELRDGRVWAGLVHGTVLRTTDGRAVFHFMRQSLARLSRYHVGLAAYAGAGVALSLTAAFRVEVLGDSLRVSLIQTGAQVVLPLLLFWMVAGLKTAFSLPADLGARWVFRLAGLQTQRVISTAKLFVFGGCCALIVMLLLALAACGWRGVELWLQGVYGVICAVLLIDVFFYLEAHVPFTRPPLPGRSSLPMTLATYIFGVPVLILLMITLEHWAGTHVWRVAEAVGAAVAVHGLMHWLRGLPSHPASADVFLDEFTEEIQTLGLSA
ncbi:hypothetical protein Terro_3916 [Terriglobus roseus DSM 18391]|uniref:ABC-2 type transport system permease protein n=2 Tax=Terriglobus roseus TaxID=392734 RepID=I3ZLK6_TERRK|nr:hypothetical protein Terro_3916 [Terriglobus roseus DSM 18391]